MHHEDNSVSTCDLRKLPETIQLFFVFFDRQFTVKLARNIHMQQTYGTRL